MNPPQLPPLRFPSHVPSARPRNAAGIAKPLPPVPPLPIRTAQLSPFAPMSSSFSSTVFLRVLGHPGTLAALIAYIDWPDLRSLLSSAKCVRDIWKTPALRDVVLSRHLPGYAQCIRLRDPQFFHEVAVSIHDVNLIIMSQNIPLHRYPMHALRTMSAILPTLEDDEMTSKLVVLALAHSRCVLLLQSLVHSSTYPMPQEPGEAKAASRSPPAPSLRELTFPAPLAYTGQPSAATVQHKDSGRKKMRSKHRPSRSLDSQPSSVFSLFGRSPKSKSVPPPEEPRTLKAYGLSWRKSFYHSDTEESGSLRRPRRRFLAENDSFSSDLSHSPSRSSVYTRRSTYSRDSPSWSAYQPPRLTSPHDLSLATSRMRAPILRVFVPSARMDPNDDTVLACESQLQDSGLWSHMSIGDVVCNLGYVPRDSEEGSTSGEDSPPLFTMRRSSLRFQSSSSPSPVPSNASRKWLIFNGTYLVPYTPLDPIPLPDPLSLPTPFYFSHLFPPSSDITYTISRFPACDQAPTFELVQSSVKVPSPTSPKGYALVKKYAWTAKVNMRRHRDGESEIGEGWCGEWVLEGEGTREGKDLLLAALRGVPLGPRQWEIVRESSGGGRIWFKLLPM